MPKRKSSEERRREIAYAAIKIIGERGLWEFTAAQIAHEVGMGILFAAKDGALPAPTGEMERRCWQTLRSLLERKWVTS